MGYGVIHIQEPARLISISIPIREMPTRRHQNSVYGFVLSMGRAEMHRMEIHVSDEIVPRSDEIAPFVDDLIKASR